MRFKYSVPFDPTMKQQIVVDPRTKKTYERNVIKTPEDRLAHMQYCQARDCEDGYSSMSEKALNDIGDIASVNSWQAHDPETGFLRFFPDTPAWVLEIGEKHHWVTGRELESFISQPVHTEVMTLIANGRSVP